MKAANSGKAAESTARKAAHLAGGGDGAFARVAARASWMRSRTPSPVKAMPKEADAAAAVAEALDLARRPRSSTRLLDEVRLQGSRARATLVCSTVGYIIGE